MRFFRRTQVGLPNGRAFPAEPSQASASGVVWYTGNVGAAFSLDDGGSFTNVDPSNIFPDGTTPFCCDQVVIYSPRINRFIWVMQYWCPPPDTRCERAGSENKLRIAVASPDDIRNHPSDLALAWRSWVVTPPSVDQPGNWLDQADIAEGGLYLYLSVNMYGRRRGGLLARTSLDGLARGNFRLHYDAEPTQGLRVVQDTAGVGLFAGHSNLSTLEVMSWNEFPRFASLIPHLISHTTIPNWNGASNTSDGRDWLRRRHNGDLPTDDTRVLSATRSGSDLWVAWDESRDICVMNCGRTLPPGQSRGFNRRYPQSHVKILKADARTYTLASERALYDSGAAFANPALAANPDGDVAITFTRGGATTNPRPWAGFLTGRPDLFPIMDSPSPGGHGDYVSLRSDFPSRSRFTASGYVTGLDGRDHWVFARFGRLPQPPPPAPGASALSLSCPGGAFVDNPLQVSGTFAPARAGVPVRITYSHPSAGTQTHTVSTDAESNFHDSFTPPVNGYWTIQAHFDGDAATTRSDSPPCTVYVQPIPS